MIGFIVLPSYFYISLHFIVKVKYLFFFCVFFLFISRSHNKFFVAEEWVKNARGETKVALDARAEVEVELGALKENHAKMAE